MFTLVNIRSASPSFDGQFSAGVNIAGLRGVSGAAAKVAQSLGPSTAPLESLFGLGAAGGIVAAGAAVAALGAK